MEYLLKIAEEIQRQTPQEDVTYRSLYSINGRPILSPLVGNEASFRFSSSH